MNKKLFGILFILLFVFGLFSVLNIKVDGSLNSIWKYNSASGVTPSWVAMTGTGGIGFIQYGLNAPLSSIQFYFKSNAGTKGITGTAQTLIFALGETDSYPTNGASAVAVSDVVDLAYGDTLSPTYKTFTFTPSYNWVNTTSYGILCEVTSGVNVSISTINTNNYFGGTYNPTFTRTGSGGGNYLIHQIYVDNYNPPQTNNSYNVPNSLTFLNGGSTISSNNILDFKGHGFVGIYGIKGDNQYLSKVSTQIKLDTTSGLGNGLYQAIIFCTGTSSSYPSNGVGTVPVAYSKTINNTNYAITTTYIPFDFYFDCTYLMNSTQYYCVGIYNIDGQGNGVDIPIYNDNNIGGGIVAYWDSVNGFRRIGSGGTFYGISTYTTPFYGGLQYSLSFSATITGGNKFLESIYPYYVSINGMGGYTTGSNLNVISGGQSYQINFNVWLNGIQNFNGTMVVATSPQSATNTGMGLTFTEVYRANMTNGLFQYSMPSQTRTNGMNLFNQVKFTVYNTSINNASAIGLYVFGVYGDGSSWDYGDTGTGGNGGSGGNGTDGTITWFTNLFSNYRFLLIIIIYSGCCGICTYLFAFTGLIAGLDIATVICFLTGLLGNLMYPVLGLVVVVNIALIITGSGLLNRRKNGNDA